MLWDGARAKFLSLAADVYGQQRADGICNTVRDLEAYGVRNLMALVK